MKFFYQCIFLFALSAFSQAKSTVSEEKEDIHAICKQSPANCLTQIQHSLDSVPAQSRVWFQYKLYQLDALFQLVKVAELKQELEPWVNVDKIPLKFKINVYIYYAKIIRQEGQTELADQYFNFAIESLTAVTEFSPEPLLVVQIANVLNTLGRYQQGYDMLTTLEQKFGRRNDALFKLELYENLGHFAYRLNKLDEHIAFRKKSISWAKKQNNKQRLAIAVFNLARAYQMVESYEESIEHFVQAREIGLQVSDFYLAEMTLFRRAEIALAKGDKKHAKALFDDIESHVIPESFGDSMAELERLINN